MKKKEFKELMKKCFGKGKDERYHAVAMLILYGIFLIFVIAFVRIAGGNIEDNVTPTPTPTSTPVEKSDIKNYTYSYTVTFDEESYVFNGKKIGDKEVFKYINNGDIDNVAEYAAVGTSYYKIVDDNYEKVDSINPYFKYLDVNKILTLIEKDNPIKSGESYLYNVNNIAIANMYSDTLNKEEDNMLSNGVFIVKNDNVIKSIRLELNNYISSVLGSEHSLNLLIELSNINETTDYEIEG